MTTTHHLAVDLLDRVDRHIADPHTVALAQVHATLADIHTRLADLHRGPPIRRNASVGAGMNKRRRPPRHTRQRPPRRLPRRPW